MMTNEQPNRLVPAFGVPLLCVAIALFSVAITIAATNTQKFSTGFDLIPRGSNLEGFLLVCIYLVTALIAFVSAEVLLRYSHTRLSIIAAHKELARVDGEIKNHAKTLQSLATKIEFTVIRDSSDQAQNQEIIAKLQELHIKIEQLNEIETDTNFEMAADEAGNQVAPAIN